MFVLAFTLGLIKCTVLSSSNTVFADMDAFLDTPNAVDKDVLGMDGLYTPCVVARSGGVACAGLEVWIQAEMALKGSVAMGLP